MCIRAKKGHTDFERMLIHKDFNTIVDDRDEMLYCECSSDIRTPIVITNTFSAQDIRTNKAAPTWLSVECMLLTRFLNLPHHVLSTPESRLTECPSTTRIT